MNKNKTIMAGIGGVALVALGVIGYLIFSAQGQKTDIADEFEGLLGNAERANAGAIPPTQESITALEANAKTLKDWYAEALEQVSAGDLTIETGIYPASFKKIMVDGARRLSKLPGEAEEGRFVKKGFNFGFPLITSGNMPEPEKLPMYQRQWAEVYHFVSLIAESGALELQNVTIAEHKVVEPPKPQKGNRQPKVAEEKAPLAAIETYSFKFTARPPALVGVINRLIEEERFVTVDALSYMRADDALATILGGGKEKEASGKRNKRKNRRSEASEEAEGEEQAANKKGLVTDPMTGVPFTVEITLSTYDFGKGTKPYSSLRTVSREVEETEETAEADAAAETNEEAAETAPAAEAETSAETSAAAEEKSEEAPAAEEAKPAAEETKEVK